MRVGVFSFHGGFRTILAGWAMILLVIQLLVLPSAQSEVDNKGYILYCPCMGRFGNQADHFLGALAWAKALDRTLVLPPWVEYHSTSRSSVQVPFDTYFKVEEVARYHRVITMEDFMLNLAPQIWPPGKRTVYCYSPRSNGECDAKSGNPFGPFWDTFRIDFDRSEFFGPLNFLGDDPFEQDRWLKKFPVKDHHVMAFMGAPAQFPVSLHDRHLHRYLVWSERISTEAADFISSNLPRPFIGIHLRNGIDWRNACEYLKEGRREMFSSSQCLGERNQHGPLTHELCLPSQDTVSRQLMKAVAKHGAVSVFIATDDNDLLDTFQRAMKDVNFVRLPQDNPHLDLAILGRADHAIVNCVSSFSSFVARERDVNNLSTDFWAFSPTSAGKSIHRQDL